MSGIKEFRAGLLQDDAGPSGTLFLSSVTAGNVSSAGSEVKMRSTKSPADLKGHVVSAGNEPLLRRGLGVTCELSLTQLDRTDTPSSGLESHFFLKASLDPLYKTTHPP